MTVPPPIAIPFGALTSGGFGSWDSDFGSAFCLFARFVGAVTICSDFGWGDAESVCGTLGTCCSGGLSKCNSRRPSGVAHPRRTHIKATTRVTSRVTPGVTVSFLVEFSPVTVRGAPWIVHAQILYPDKTQFGEVAKVVVKTEAGKMAQAVVRTQGFPIGQAGQYTIRTWVEDDGKKITDPEEISIELEMIAPPHPVATSAKSI
jgi:hypothetical protein